MSSEALGIGVSNPEYFHREYENDLPRESSGNYYVDQSKRIALVALPFLSLYKPLGFPLSLTMGGLRSVTSVSQLLSELQAGDLSKCSYALLQTVISVVALGGTLFAHPLGMLVTTVHDCALDCLAISQNLYSGDFQSALGTSASLVNNALYLALFTHGGLEIAIASLAMQVFIGLSHSVTEYQKGNYLEAGGHFLMGIIRGNQLAGQIQLIQMKWQIRNILNQAADNINPKSDLQSNSNKETISMRFESAPEENELVDIFIKYGKNNMGLSAFGYSIECGDFKAAKILMRNGADVNALDGKKVPIQRAIEHTYGVELDKHPSLQKKQDLKDFILALVESPQFDPYEKVGNYAHGVYAFMKSCTLYIDDNQFSLDIAKLLVDRKVDLNFPGWNYSVVSISVHVGKNLNFMKALMELGAHTKNVRLSEIPLDLNSPLFDNYYDSDYFIEYLELLKSKGTSFKGDASPGKTQIDVLLAKVLWVPDVSGGKEFKKEVVQYLLKQGASI